MIKARAYFFFALLLLSCSKTKDAHAGQPILLPSPNNGGFNVNVVMKDFGKEREDKIMKAVTLIRKVVISEEFKERILNHSYKGKKTFINNEGLSNEEIYRKILAGSETLSPEENNAMDVELELYFEPANTIGHTYPHVKNIWLNTKYLDKFSPDQISDNLFHEWLHKLGFNHESKYSESRRYSVPYAIGYLVRELAQKHSLD